MPPSHPSPPAGAVATPAGREVSDVTVLYRGPDPRMPTVVITERHVKERFPGGWRSWVIADLHDLRICHARPAPERIMTAAGTSVVLIGLLARRLDGWPLIVVVAVLVSALVLTAVDHLMRGARTPSQLRARYRGSDIVVLEMPRRDLEVACRGLVRALERREDTR